jgi:hypothetical protein
MGRPGLRRKAGEIGLSVTTFQGAGRYVVSGDRLARFPDQGPPDANLFRIIERHDVNPLGEAQTFVELAQMKANVLADGTRLPFEVVMGQQTR